MFLKKTFSKPTGTCQIHGSAKTVNSTLIILILASFSLVIWHVWFYGPTAHMTESELPTRSFPLLVGREVWDLLFNKHGIFAELRDIFPYFIAGIFLAGYLRTFKVAIKLRAKLRKHGVLSVFLASLLGIMTPLCACGTLTTAVSLLFAGIPLAPIMALMVTSPLLSPSTYLLTLNDLGPEWTVIRTLAAFSMGLLAGLVTHFLRKRGFQTETIFIEGAITRGDFHDENYPDERLRCNCKEKFGNRVAIKTSNKFVIFLAKSFEMLWTVGKYILVGVAIGSIVERYMPSDWISRFFGRNDPWNIVWITFASVPVFLHQISASSILYHVKGTLQGTLDGGAALAFMIAGPVTAMPTMVLFWSIFKKRVFFLYLAVCIAGSIIIAYGFQAFVSVPGVDTGNPLLKGVGSLTGGSSSVIQKLNRNVRIVMDPNGKNIIATYSNDLDGQGGVVFDSGVGRFLDGAAERYDNSRYIRNLADWMRQNNCSSTKGSILIYDTFHHIGLAGKAFENIPQNLVQHGFKAKLTDRKETPQITAQVLAGYSQIWMIFGEAGPEQQLTDGELAALSRFVGEGKSMLIVAVPPGDRTPEMRAENRLSSRFGVIFSGDARNGEELPAGIAPHLLDRISGVLGSILKLVHKA